MGISNLLRVGHLCAPYIILINNRLEQRLASLGYSLPHTKYEKKKEPIYQNNPPKTLLLHHLPACCGIDLTVDCTKDRQHPLENPSKTLILFARKLRLSSDQVEQVKADTQ